MNADKECGECFARTGGSREQRGAPGKDLRPALLLRLGGRTEASEEPLRNQRMRPGQRDRNFPNGHWAIVAEFRCLFAARAFTVEAASAGGILFAREVQGVLTSPLLGFCLHSFDLWPK